MWIGRKQRLSSRLRHRCRPQFAPGTPPSLRRPGRRSHWVLMPQPGKVAVVQFWSYTCGNWRRTLPYIRAWDAKYRERGLVVIGVHTPEFDFEENVANVRTALGEMHIDYPVAIDNKHVIWNAFHNV